MNPFRNATIPFLSEKKPSFQMKWNEIGDEIASKFNKDIVTTLKDLGDEDDTLSGSGRKKMWRMMKKRYPKVTPANAKVEILWQITLD